MKKRYLPIIAISAALFAWNCGENSSNNSSNDDTQSVSELPYYVAGYTIDPATGTVYNLATGEVAGQLNADGTITDAAGNIFLAADTTLLPNITSLGYLVDNNGNVTDISGNVIGTLNADGKSITLTDGSVQDLSGNEISGPTSSENIASSSSESIPEPDPSATLVASVAVGDIYSDLTVRDASGAVIGTFDSTTGYITLANGTVVDTNGTVIAEKSSNSTGNSSASNIASSASFVNSSASEITSSASQQQGSITVTGNLTQSAAKNTSISTIVFSGVTAEPSRNWTLSWLTCAYDQSAKTYTVSGTVPDWFQEGTSSETFTFSDATFTLTLTVGNVTPSSSSNQQIASSSSVWTWSSSSVASSSSVRSSSSVASSSSVSISTGCPNIVTKSGSSGSGWATRYWDGCKPSCSWTNNAGSGNEARQCTANGKTELSDLNAQSVCTGGSAATCTSQIPFTISGCDNIGFAFAAVPAANGGQCGKCFQLTFTGTGKYETKANHKALVGKSLIVMVTNIGSDVNQGQFDVMIPGGGVGIYNGTAGYGWGSQGATYGGLLTECEEEVGYSNSVNYLTDRKACLVKKCNASFSSDAQAKEGCLFLANFMEAAGNPNHTYTEVECPDVLKAKY